MLSNLNWKFPHLTCFVKHIYICYGKNSNSSMFNGRTAWFSSSVEEEKKELWCDYEGLIDTFELAEYIFSEDADCDDTKGIFESSPYLDECLSVFHPAYICECVKNKSRENVKIGKYFFPPTEIQDYMRREGMPFGWEPDRSDNTCEKRWEPRLNVNKEKSQTNIVHTSPRHESNVKQSAAKRSPRYISNVKPSTSKQSEPHQRDIEEMTENNHTSKNVRNELNSSRTIYRQEENNKDDTVQHTKVDSRVGVSTRRHRNKTNNIVDEIPDSSVHKDTVVRVDQEEYRTKNSVVHKWNGIEVLRLQDLSKVTGAWLPFKVGENNCEFETN